MRWVNSPPVRIVSDEDFETYAKAYIKELESWKAKGKKLDDEQTRWNNDIDSRITEANVYKSPGIKIVYKLADGVAALMRMTEKVDSFKIEDLSAHPGGSGGGVILVEWAVSYSQQNSKAGVVTLFDASNSPGYYKTVFGFSGDDQQLRLDPHEHLDLWFQFGTQWKLKKYITNEGVDRYRFLAEP